MGGDDIHERGEPEDVRLPARNEGNARRGDKQPNAKQVGERLKELYESIRGGAGGVDSEHLNNAAAQIAAEMTMDEFGIGRGRGQSRGGSGRP